MPFLSAAWRYGLAVISGWPEVLRGRCQLVDLGFDGFGLLGQKGIRSHITIAHSLHRRFHFLLVGLHQLLLRVPFKQHVGPISKNEASLCHEQSEFFVKLCGRIRDKTTALSTTKVNK